jgi:hypothetical protein
MVQVAHLVVVVVVQAVAARVARVRQALPAVVVSGLAQRLTAHPAAAAVLVRSVLVPHLKLVATAALVHRRIQTGV